MRLPLWKAQQCQGNNSRTANVFLFLSNIVQFDLLRAVTVEKQRETPYTTYLPVFVTLGDSFHFQSVSECTFRKITKAVQFVSYTTSLP